MANTELLTSLTISRLQALHRDGFVLLPRVLDAKWIATLHEVRRCRIAW